MQVMLSDRLFGEARYVAACASTVEDALQRIKEWSKGGQSVPEMNASLMKIYNLTLTTLDLFLEEREKEEGD